MYKEFLEIDHRPYPLPSKPWMMTQVWRDLLFIHWPVASEVIKPHLPQELELDVYEGTAWLSFIPLRITNARARGLPLIPFFTSYMELNVRTYVSMTVFQVFIFSSWTQTIFRP